MRPAARTGGHAGPDQICSDEGDAVGGDPYWVQVGAFKPGGAVARRGSGIRPSWAGSATVVLDKASATVLTRVRVGPFPERSEAMAHLHVLEARGYKPFVAADLAADRD